jgi:hypothetical protein
MDMGTRIFMAFLLLMAAAPARAEWVRADKAGRGFFSGYSASTVYYFDPSTITKDGIFRRVWEIHDLDDKGSSGERSVLAQVEYDCADKRMRTLKATGRSLGMARGEIISLRGVLDDWITLRPGKEDEILFKILDAVCAPTSGN